MVAQFSFRQYLAAFRAGITVMVDSHLSLFLFFGMLAFMWQKRFPALTILPIDSRTRRVQPQAQMSQQESAGSRSQVAQFSPTAGSTAPMGAASAALASAGYAALHYIVLPNSMVWRVLPDDGSVFCTRASTIVQTSDECRRRQRVYLDWRRKV